MSTSPPDIEVMPFKNSSVSWLHKHSFLITDNTGKQCGQADSTAVYIQEVPDASPVLKTGPPD
jgi:hypothetical protein